MREPPPLPFATLTTALQSHYQLVVAGIAFLPLGNDADSAVYRVVTTDGPLFFLKLRAGAGFNAASLAVPHHLHRLGIPHIAAPLATRTGALWLRVDRFALSLYPLIDGRTAVEAGLDEEAWAALGRTLKQVHSAPLPDAVRMLVRREAYIPSRRAVIAELETAVARPDLADTAQRELAAFWQRHRGEIRRVVTGADRLGHELRQRSLPPVLCHADLHTWNILVERDHSLWIVDWDETVLAAKERDLMFVVEGIGRDLVSADESAAFLRGYGATTIDPAALTYYRYAWAVQDIAAYGERVFFTPDISLASRLEAAQGLMAQFEPGNIVSIALASQTPPTG